MNNPNSSKLLDEIHASLIARLDTDPTKSYSASLFDKGLDTILKKIAEEAAEVVMAAKDGAADKIIYETADLWFHCMVLLAHQGLEPEQVLDELARRRGVSGLVEKAGRTK
jgi:phosphoribosyl-ATP pyrophosphohydrolase